MVTLVSLFRSRFELSFEFPPLVNPPLVNPPLVTHFDLIPDFSNLLAIPSNLIFPRRDETRILSEDVLYVVQMGWHRNYLNENTLKIHLYG